MKSKKKTKKAKGNKKATKSTKKGDRRMVMELVAIAKEQERATNPHAGSKFEDFMKLEQERFGLTTEKCGCTPEKGCLDTDAAERQWKTEVLSNWPTAEEYAEVAEAIAYERMDLFSKLFYNIKKLFKK